MHLLIDFVPFVISILYDTVEMRHFVLIYVKSTAHQSKIKLWCHQRRRVEVSQLIKFLVRKYFLSYILMLSIELPWLFNNTDDYLWSSWSIILHKLIRIITQIDVHLSLIFDEISGLFQIPLLFN